MVSFDALVGWEMDVRQVVGERERQGERERERERERGGEELDYDKEAACKKYFPKIHCFTSPMNGPHISLQHCKRVLDCRFVHSSPA